ncbi:MAG: L,D-transpeptidase family protein [Roseiarcus sp.]
MCALAAAQTPNDGASPAQGVAAPAPAPAPVSADPLARRKAAPQPSAANSALVDPTPTLQPETLFATSKAAEQYAGIVKAGGWPTDNVELRPRAIGPAVAELRKRLAIEGDLGPDAPVDGPAAEIWDRTLTAAVERFQSRMGLAETGAVDRATAEALNVPAEARARALAESAARLSAFDHFAFGDRYVVVNLPSATVEAVENGRVVHRYKAIVGGPDHPSPEIAAHVVNVNLNPTWTVPVSIIKNEIIPRMQRDPGYLARERIRILDGQGVEIDPGSINWTTNSAANYILRQDAGAGNSLGLIRIDMPNRHAVYMHDTPSKRLFGADYRFLSHGCVRVQGVYDYAEWLLAGTPTADGGAWNTAEMSAQIKTGAHEDIRLAKPVPVIWIYLTGWANDDGAAHFRKDVYGLDAAPLASPSADLTAAAPPPSP